MEATTTVNSLLRSSQAFCSELCEKETLDYGIAFYSPRFAALPEANQLREVWIEDPTEISVAFEQAEHWFAEHSLFCHRWAPAGGKSNLQLSGFLEERGFRPRNLSAMALREWAEFEATPEVRVLPARAMKAALRQTYLDSNRPANERLRELLADAYIERLDDPQLDMFVALADKKPAGRAGLYQVGDIAQVVELSVLKGFEKQNVEAALLAHVLALAKRLSFRKVLMQVDGADGNLHDLLKRAGFATEGEIVEFEREAPQDLFPMILKARYVVSADREPIENGAIRVDCGKVAEVAKAGRLRRPADCPVEDFGDAVVLPGLVNAHTHLELSLLRGVASPSSGFVPWIRVIAQHLLHRPPTKEQVEAAVRTGIARSQEDGVALVGDISRFPAWSRPVLAGSSLRAVSFGEVLGVGSRRDQLPDRCTAAADSEAASPGLRLGISPHSPYSVEPAGLEACAKLAASHRLPLCIHLAESLEEIEFTKTGTGPIADFLREMGAWDDRIPVTGLDPIELAAQSGLLGPSTVIAHANYVSNENIARIAASGTSVAYCPRTHAAFGHPPHRFREMLRAGVNVCIGTDSLASNPSLSVLEELCFLHGLFPNVPASVLLAMGTTAGAKALGLQDTCGVIAPGRPADFIVVPATTGLPLRNWEEILDSQCRPAGVFVAGRLLSRLPL